MMNCSQFYPWVGNLLGAAIAAGFLRRICCTGVVSLYDLHFALIAIATAYLENEKKLELTEVMNIDTFKLELIQWILLLQDIQLLNEIHNIKGKSLENTTAIQPRKFGCGKGIFTYMADDFDVTPPGFV